MLINPQLNNKCCSTSHINSILGSIDKTLANISLALLNNIRFSLTNEIPSDTFQDLVLYKDIIKAKIMGNESLQHLSWDVLLSKVKNILNKQNY